MGAEGFLFLLFLFEKIYWLKEQTFWVFVYSHKKASPSPGRD